MHASSQVSATALLTPQCAAEASAAGAADGALPLAVCSGLSRADVIVWSACCFLQLSGIITGWLTNGIAGFLDAQQLQARRASRSERIIIHRV